MKRTRCPVHIFLCVSFTDCRLARNSNVPKQPKPLTHSITVPFSLSLSPKRCNLFLSIIADKKRIALGFRRSLMRRIADSRCRLWLDDIACIACSPKVPRLHPHRQQRLSIVSVCTIRQTSQPVARSRQADPVKCTDHAAAE